MVKTLLLVAALAGCGMRVNGARDATLPYHPTYAELREAPLAPATAAAAAPRTTRARIVVDGFARAYPQPIGLAYSGDGAMRAVTEVIVADGELEAQLAAGVGARVVGAADGDSAGAAHLGGGVVEHARYRFGGTTYASAMLELRVTRGGTEVYAARYRALVRGGDGLEAQLASNLVDQIGGDDRLFAALEKTP
ncbi:MAG: hypothetical protein KF773_10075 [Deltaproteobacteria bacterium]|nr:hypothetical protein [Deltaproteobacteria bacterium]